MGYSHGKMWSEDDIKDAIMTIVNERKMETFPSKSEIIEFYGNSSLANRISKRGGTRRWAKEVNLPIKKSESEFGDKYEKYAIQDIAKHTGLIATQMKPRYPYDIAVDGNIKVDIKASRMLFNRNGFGFNTFNLEKSNPTCDIYILYCLNSDGTPCKTIIIPSCLALGKTQIGVGGESKWDVYKDNWNVLLRYKDFYSSLKENEARKTPCII